MADYALDHRGMCFPQFSEVFSRDDLIWLRDVVLKGHPGIQSVLKEWIP